MKKFSKGFSEICSGKDLGNVGQKVDERCKPSKGIFTHHKTDGVCNIIQNKFHE